MRFSTSYILLSNYPTHVSIIKFIAAWYFLFFKVDNLKLPVFILENSLQNFFNSQNVWSTWAKKFITKLTFFLEQMKPKRLPSEIKFYLTFPPNVPCLNLIKENLKYCFSSFNSRNSWFLLASRKYFGCYV